MFDPAVCKVGDAIQRFTSSVHSASADGRPPLALIVPSTTRTTEESIRLHGLGVASMVGDGATPGALRPADVVSLIRSETTQPDLIVFSDQILHPADASILVRTDTADMYFSPIETILNVKYGYRLAIWTAQDYKVIEPRATEISMIFSALVGHLHDCATIPQNWNMREAQKQRLPLGRRRMARRKLRLLKSAVIDAFRFGPDDLATGELLGRVEAMERQMECV